MATLYTGLPSWLPIPTQTKQPLMISSKNGMCIYLCLPTMIQHNFMGKLTFPDDILITWLLQAPLHLICKWLPSLLSVVCDGKWYTNSKHYHLILKWKRKLGCFKGYKRWESAIGVAQLSSTECFVQFVAELFVFRVSCSVAELSTHCIV